MKRYKATLFKSEKSTLNPTSSWRTTPIDTVLLEKKCHETAENLFFKKRGWPNPVDDVLSGRIFHSDPDDFSSRDGRCVFWQ